MSLASRISDLAGAIRDKINTESARVAAIENTRAKVHVGTTAPSSPAVGDLWVDTN